ncbi:Fanconi anemia group G protein [Leucoraja erinacea]|uniref:Fanconi anemia group G protein n=1 Tax=Leucoraja erinaceus TaxID=7782 RepID=UPI002457EAD4|nr:Fanconi anemia group G protein [Leucoraja erinacea]
MESVGSKGCLEMWTEENAKLVAELKNISTNTAKWTDILRQNFVYFIKLLEKIQGLPPTIPSIPLELTVLYNAIVLNISLSDVVCNDDSLLLKGFTRGLEAYGKHFDERGILKLWEMTFRSISDPTFIQTVDQLIYLQCLLWLSRNQLEDVEVVLHMLRERSSSVSGVNIQHDDLWQCIKTGNLLKDSSGSHLLLVQSLSTLGKLMYTCATFLRGFHKVEQGHYLEAIDILQPAAEGLCSKRILAEIYTLIGYSSVQMGRPQTGLQYFRWALQADIQCFPALYHAAMVYRQLEIVEAELEALNHLSVLLESWDQSKDANHVEPQTLIQPEQLVRIPSTSHLLTSVNQVYVKHSLARRCLQMGRTEEAAEYYLDLLASFFEGSQKEIFLVADSTVPRIPEIYLEAAVALLQCQRYNDVITICEEISCKMSTLLSEKLTFEIIVNEWLPKDCLERTEIDMVCQSSHSEHLNQSQTHCATKKETLNYILWMATAFLYQAQAFALLGNNKESLTNFSRCVNLLLKVQVVGPSDSGQPNNQIDTLKENIMEIKYLQKLKSLAFVGKGMQLTERGQDREALQNFHLSLQACSDSMEAAYNLVQVLWKLKRKDEAVSFWKKYYSSTKAAAEKVQQASGSQKFPLFLISHLKEVSTSEEEAVSKMVHTHYIHHSKEKSTAEFLRPMSYL